MRHFHKNQSAPIGERLGAVFHGLVIALVGGLTLGAAMHVAMTMI